MTRGVRATPPTAAPDRHENRKIDPWHLQLSFRSDPPVGSRISGVGPAVQRVASPVQLPGHVTVQAGKKLCVERPHQGAVRTSNQTTTRGQNESASCAGSPGARVRLPSAVRLRVLAAGSRAASLSLNSQR